MSVKWEHSLDPKDPQHPILVYVVLGWHPFTYAVSLAATFDGEQRIIRRWDNVDNKPDHVDVFYFSGRVEKHVRAPLAPIKNTADLKELGDMIAKRYRYYINASKNG